MRTTTSACQLCDLVYSRPQSSLLRPIRRHLSSTKPSAAAWHQNTRIRPPNTVIFKTRGRTKTTESSHRNELKEATDGSRVQLRSFELEASLREVASERDALLAGEQVPTEFEVLKALMNCEILAKSCVNPQGHGGTRETLAASTTLLSIDEQKSSSGSLTLPSFVQVVLKQLSQIAYSILTGGNVFLTPEILSLYVKMQAMLRSPETFPDVFYLYAHKPVPLEGTDPIRFREQKPNSYKNAIDKETAELALQCAIATRQLTVAFAIVENTYAAHAFQRRKLLGKALLPGFILLGAAPLGSYGLAQQLAAFQNTIDTNVATNLAFIGICTYVASCASMGYLALTTSNDQMERVSWMPGVPLWERWVREEERAALDRIAMAWGFKERWKRGEEEGEDWEALRDYCGSKGVILDRTCLMDDME